MSETESHMLLKRLGIRHAALSLWKHRVDVKTHHLKVLALKSVLSTLKDDAKGCYQVFGGFIRDKLSDTVPSDIDIVVDESKWNHVVKALTEGFGKKNVSDSDRRILRYGHGVKTKKVKIDVIIKGMIINVAIDMVHNPGTYVFFRANALMLNDKGGIEARLFKSSFLFLPNCFKEISSGNHSLLLDFEVFASKTGLGFKQFIKTALYRSNRMLSRGYQVKAWFNLSDINEVLVSCKCDDLQFMTIDEFIMKFTASTKPFYTCKECKSRIGLRGEYLYTLGEISDSGECLFHSMYDGVDYFKQVHV